MGPFHPCLSCIICTGFFSRRLQILLISQPLDSRDGKCESRDEGISVNSEAASKQGHFELQKPATGLNGFLGRHEVNESSGEFALLAPICGLPHYLL